MHSAQSDSNNDGKDSDFRDFLREVLAGHRSIDELLLCPHFTRLIGYCLVLTRNQADADDLYIEVSWKVSRSFMTRFRPDFSKKFGGFRAWSRTVTRNCFLEGKRPHKIAIASERPEDLVGKVDARAVADVLRVVENNEMREELDKCIQKQPEPIRSAARLYVQRGFSSSETAKELAKLGIDVTPATVRNWVHAALVPFFPNALAFSDSELARKDNKMSKGQAAVAARPGSSHAIPVTSQQAKVIRKQNKPAVLRRTSAKAPKSQPADARAVKKKRRG